MLYSLHLDPSAIKHWTFQTLGTKCNTPLIIHDTLIFVPVKLRKSIGRQDGCFGYVNSNHIQFLEDHQITLCHGEQLSTLSSKSYLDKKLTDAKLLRYAYVDHKKQYEFMWKNPS